MAGKVFKKAALGPGTLLCIIILWGGFAPFVSPSCSTAGARHAEISSRSDISKIVSVLESRTEDKRVLGKAADKLLTLSARRIRLMSSLCERISAGDGTVGADIAFSLVTALIVFS